MSLNSVRQRDAKTSLYYAALCGFSNLVEQLIIKYPQDANAISGYYWTPAVAALAGRHFEMAQVLHRNGSSVEPRDDLKCTPLHSAAYHGNLEMVQVLLEYGVDVDCPNQYGSTPLNYAPRYGHRNAAKIARLLIERGADSNTRGYDGDTPLHQASQCGMIDIARLLIEHGANIEAKNDIGSTPLDVARGDEMRNLLLEVSAK